MAQKDGVVDGGGQREGRSGDEASISGDAGGRADLATAVAVARRLLGEIVGTLETRDDATAGAAATALAESQAVLSRLAASAAPAAPKGDAAATALVLDVSDLIGYLATNRLPTGIQRVQIELVRNILKADAGTALCCFVETRLEWVTVNVALFMDVCDQSCSGGDPLEARWLATIRKLQEQVGGAPAFPFPHGAVLANVGTSWWLPNYFLYVRQAKIAAGVRYVPLIYDLIPILMPENCDPELVQEFIGWFIGVLKHSDFFLAISEATKRDLIAVSAAMGRPVAADRIAVVRLDADFRLPNGRAAAPSRFHEPFVLFVSTIEARKNQVGALDAWATLIARHGLNKVPRLVLVGKYGFQHDRVLARLEANGDLRERVTLLSGIEDSELQALYRDCRFTIYPSVYEGWGLPITESLAYGKVPLIADNSSLPEAGGATALYFPTGSNATMVAELERLMFDDAHRARQERIIRQGFHPRSWAAIAGEVHGHVLRWAKEAQAREWLPPLARPGAYYPMARNRSADIWPGIGSAESFRSGLGWHRLEDIGCWIHPTGAELTMRPAPGATRIAFRLTCAPQSRVRYRIAIAGHETAATGLIEGDGTQWAFIDLPEARDDAALRFLLDATILMQPSRGQGVDHRRLSVALSGFFIFGDDPHDRIDFIEAVALGALANFDAYRDRSPT